MTDSKPPIFSADCAARREAKRAASQEQRIRQQVASELAGVFGINERIAALLLEGRGKEAVTQFLDTVSLRNDEYGSLLWFARDMIARRNAK